jgi:hypothetical protein
MPTTFESLYARLRPVSVLHHPAERGGRDSQGSVVALADDVDAFRPANAIRDRRALMLQSTAGAGHRRLLLAYARRDKATAPSYLNPATPGPAGPPSYLNPATPGPAGPPS